MNKSYWRNKAQAVIWRIMEKYPSPQTKEEAKAIAQEIDQAYPFGERYNHPYKIWLEEKRKAMIQLGLAKAPVKTTSAKKPKKPQPKIGTDNDIVQLSLFDQILYEQQN